MKLRVTFLLALALLAFGASMLVVQDTSTPRLQRVSNGVTSNVDLLIQPCGDPIGGPGLPH